MTGSYYNSCSNKYSPWAQGRKPLATHLYIVCVTEHNWLGLGIGVDVDVSMWQHGNNTASSKSIKQNKYYMHKNNSKWLHPCVRSLYKTKIVNFCNDNCFFV